MSTEEFIERYVIQHGFVSDEEREKERMQFLVRMHRELQKLCQEEHPDDKSALRLRTIASFENLSSRIVGALYDAGYKSIGDLEGLTFDELRTIPGLGEVGIWQLANKLSQHGVVFKQHRLTIN